MLASATIPHRRQHQPNSFQPSYPQTLTIPTSNWSSNPTISTPQPQHTATANTIFSFEDQPLFDYQPYHSNQPSSLMQAENHWLEHGQLTPRSTTRAHHRESSLSSLGSAGPASPYTANTSNPQVVGDIYNDFHDFHPTSSKPLTPAHTPSQENFLPPHYSNFYHNSNFGFTMGHDGLPKQSADAEGMPAPEFNHSGRPSIASLTSRDSHSPSTPPSHEEERQKKCIQKYNAETRSNNDGHLRGRVVQSEFPDHFSTSYFDTCTNGDAFPSKRRLLAKTSGCE
jgi:hypothetical protein